MYRPLFALFSSNFLQFKASFRVYTKKSVSQLLFFDFFRVQKRIFLLQTLKEHCSSAFKLYLGSASAFFLYRPSKNIVHNQLDYYPDCVLVIFLYSSSLPQYCNLHTKYSIALYQYPSCRLSISPLYLNPSLSSTSNFIL